MINDDLVISQDEISLTFFSNCLFSKENSEDVKYQVILGILTNQFYKIEVYQNSFNGKI